MNIPTAYWAKYTFPNYNKCNHVTNNMTESFNNWINSFRGMPSVRMLEEIKRKVMKLIHKRNEAATKWNDIYYLLAGGRLWKHKLKQDV